MLRHLPSLTAMLVTTLLGASNVSAAQLTVLLPACTNLSMQECDAVAVLFSNAYERASGAPVVRPPPSSETQAPAADAQTLAPDQAEEFIEISAVRLTSKVQLRAVRRTPRQVIYSVEMTASSLDDLPPVTDRMALALFRTVPVEQTRAIRTITRTEATRRNSLYSEKIIGFKTGYVQPVASGTNFNSMITLQFDGRFEAETYFLEFGAGLAMPSDEGNGRGMGGLFAEFGGSVYLGEGNISPYVGGGVSPRLWFTSADGGVRGAVYGQGGLMFMRFSSTRLYADVRLTQNVTPISVSTNSTSGFQPEKSVYPTEIGLNLGIGW